MDPVCLLDLELSWLGSSFIRSIARTPQSFSGFALSLPRVIYHGQG